MPVPSQIGTAPPGPTSRTTSHSTASWCSTAHFSPTSSPTTSITFTSHTISTASIASPKTTAAASSTEDNFDQNDENGDLIGILLPCLGAGITIAILLLFACMFWRMRRITGRARKAMFKRRGPDSTPLITIPHSPAPNPGMPSSSLDHIEAVDLTEGESGLCAEGGEDVMPPPPYAP
jgi:hypothetical protein